MLNFNQNFECLTKPVIQREKIAYTDVDKNSHLQLIRHHVSLAAVQAIQDIR